MNQTQSQQFAAIIQRDIPDAVAIVEGNSWNRRIEGTVSFYQTAQGVLITAAIRGLPVSRVRCGASVFALHIHEGTACTGTTNNPFSDVGEHYNPHSCAHPYHAGDLPPLFANYSGFAWMAVLTNRFRLSEVMGRAVVIHSAPDDFASQPSGNAGMKIACGLITPTRRNTSIPG